MEALNIMPVIRSNRPIHRYMARLFCRFRYGRPMAHASDWWPGLRLFRPGSQGVGSITYRGKLIAPLLEYPSMLTGTEELLIVGSGPSLANQVTSRIPLRSALLLNGAIHLLDAAHERPFAVIVEDERFIWRHRETLVEKIPAGTDCYFSTSVIRALCETIPTWLADQRVRHLNFLHRPYGIKRPDRPALKSLPFQRWSDDNTVAVSLAPQFGFMPAGSVAVTAAQLALFLAPARIGFAGVDLNETHRPRFYEKPDDMAMSRLDAAIDNILASLHLIADECSRRGIVIENYSPNSMLKNIGIRYVSRLSK